MSRPRRSTPAKKKAPAAAAAVTDAVVDAVVDAADDEQTPLRIGAPRTESDEATARRMLGLLRAGADFRARKVRRLRAAVRVKAYENDLKLMIAVDRMQKDLDRMSA